MSNIEKSIIIILCHKNMWEVGKIDQFISYYRLFILSQSSGLSVWSILPFILLDVIHGLSI